MQCNPQLCLIASQVCSHDTAAFLAVQLVYEGGLVLVGCVLAYKTRNMNDDFGEPKQLILAMYNIALVASIVLIVAFAVEAYDGTMRIFVTVGVCWCTIFSSGVFVLPRLLRVKESTRDRMNGPGLRTRVSGLSLGTPSGASVVNMSSTVASSRNITHEQVIDEDGEKEEEKEEESAKPEQADATENMTKTDDAAQASASQG